MTLTAYSTPCSVGKPDEAAAPDSGRSTPILIVPLVPPLVPPPPPQAKATNAATMRTPSPLVRTIRFPFCFWGARPLGPARPPSNAALFPTFSSRGESAPAANAATWGGRTTTPGRTIDLVPPSSQASPSTGVGDAPATWVQSYINTG